MPVYAVWWSDKCRATLVQADDPQRLFTLLEEQGDPSDVSYTQCPADFVLDLTLVDSFVHPKNHFWVQNPRPSPAVVSATDQGASLQLSKALAVTQLQRDFISLLRGTPVHSVAEAPAHAGTVKGGSFCEEYSDVELVCSGQRFKAHRLILAARSEYFRTMFKAGMAESTSREVHIKDVSADALSCILQYLYTGHLDLRFPEPEVAQFQTAGKKNVRVVSFALQVLEAANSFLMTELREHCEAAISGFNLSLSELIEALTVADRVGAQGLKRSCLLQLKEHKRLPLILAELQEDTPLSPEILQLICQAAKLPPLESPNGRLLLELYQREVNTSKVKE